WPHGPRAPRTPAWRTPAPRTPPRAALLRPRRRSLCPQERVEGAIRQHAPHCWQEPGGDGDAVAGARVACGDGLLHGLRDVLGIPGEQLALVSLGVGPGDRRAVVRGGAVRGGD